MTATRVILMREHEVKPGVSALELREAVVDRSELAMVAQVAFDEGMHLMFELRTDATIDMRAIRAWLQSGRSLSELDAVVRVWQLQQ